MALELVQPGIQPLGQFDGHDNVYLTVLGGEVATIVGVALRSAGGTDRFAADVDDGYVGTTRPVVTTNLTSGDRPLFLVDEGIRGYGTLFGSVIGGVAGQISDGVGQYNGQLLGPHTAAGSGKLTLWDKPGTYAVTLDAVHTDPVVGLVPTNATLAIGDPLYALSNGKLTPAAASSFESSGVPEVGYFLNFESWKGGSLVTTPVNLVSAANSPVGQGQPQANSLHRALIHFNPPSQT
jgi:hypothetical protein